MISARPEIANFERSAQAILAAFLDAAESRPESYEVSAKERGYELSLPQKRPRLRLVVDAERVFIFCYKPSQLDFSKDRFSYGALRLRSAELPPIQAALDFLAANFVPSARPQGLQRILKFALPED